MTAIAHDPQEQRVVLRNTSWETYERLLAEHENSSAPRFVYDRGELEIVSPLPRHERFARALETIGDALGDALGLSIDTSFGSTTFRREETEAGFEADACFYVANEPRVRGKDRIDLRRDPPPDVVVEIDITSPSLPRLPLYARLVVPELWRYNGERLEILVLGPSGYAETAESRALPSVTAGALTALLAELEGREWIAWRRRVRAWARGLAERGDEQ